MKFSHIALALVLVAFMLGTVAACRTVAISGPQKYKVDISNVLLKMKLELDRDGQITDATISKLENVLAKHEEEFAGKGSYLRAQEILQLEEIARAEPAKAFHQHEAIKMDIDMIFEMLKTEIK